RRQHAAVLGSRHRTTAHDPDAHAGARREPRRRADDRGARERARADARAHGADVARARRDPPSSTAGTGTAAGGAGPVQGRAAAVAHGDQRVGTKRTLTEEWKRNDGSFEADDEIAGLAGGRARTGRRAQPPD